MTTRARKLPAGFWSGTKGKTGRKRAPLRRTRPTVALAQAVRTIVRRGEETKSIGLVLENAVQHNAAITNADIGVVLPGMAQGTANTQRIGDKVSPVSIRINGATSINDQSLGFIDVPLTVKVMCLQAKGIRDSNLVTANAPLNQLMDNGGTTSWDGSTANSLFKINLDLFTVLGSRTFKLGDTTAENTRSMSKRWSMKIKCPSTLKFGNGALYPDNFAPFFVLGWCRDDGTTPTFGQLWVVNTTNVFFQYKDA